jgi:ABC-type branched-subunit amino acid transport system ATPase component
MVGLTDRPWTYWVLEEGRAVLRTDCLTVRFGGLAAVADVSLEVEPGSFVGLIGPNGAGKTTFVDALTGLVQSSGEIWFDGARIDRMPAYRRSRAGLGRTFQSLELFEELTVQENLSVVAERPRWYGPVKDLVRPRLSKAAQRVVSEALDKVGLESYRDAMPAELSLGQRKLVTIARTLSTSPRLALLDEPAAGLDSVESIELGKRLRAVVDTGTTILMIDHDMGLVLSVCDQIHVLEFGKLIASGSSAEIRTDERVIHAYLGASETGDLLGPSA